MSTSWVAGVVRAKALGRRRLGRAGVRALACSGSLPEALATLAGTPYGNRVQPGLDLARAQRAVAESALWNLRVLAGWLPAPGAEALRVLAGWFEIANVDELLREFGGRPSEGPYRLGSLATSWPQLAGAASPGELRERLGRTAWGESGGDGPWEVQLGMRLVWAGRVAARVPVPQARPLAAGAAALLLARETVLPGRPLPAALTSAAGRVVGSGATGASSLGELLTALPSSARWALEGVTEPAELWAAETRWWRRLEDRSLELLGSAQFDAAPVLGSVGLLAVDAWRVRAALALAGRAAPSGVLDAVA